jgi:hypothetical protein
MRQRQRTGEVTVSPPLRVNFLKQIQFILDDLMIHLYIETGRFQTCPCLSLRPYMCTPLKKDLRGFYCHFESVSIEGGI